MTRFARAKGSKASNERLPEEATGWHVMKQQLIESQMKTEEPPASTSTEGSVSQKTDTEKEKNIQWSDFPDTKPMKATEETQPSKQKKKKRAKKESEATEEQSQEPAENKTVDCEAEKPVKKSKGGKKRKFEEVTEKTDGQVTKKPKESVNKKFDKSDKFTNNKGTNNKNNKKKFKSDNFKRRKPENTEAFMGIHGTTIEIVYFDGFPVKKEDAFRLAQLKKDLIKKGVPRHAIETTIKLERRRAEKELSKEKSKVCFNCRKSGHNISDCPALQNGPNQEITATGICFKCGSTQHVAIQCKVTKGDSFQFATCFICKQVGHISRQCPDNSRGIYPRGGSCNMCGDVTHLKINCPMFQAEKQENTIFAQVINDDVEALGNESKKVVKAPIPQAKHVRF